MPNSSSTQNRKKRLESSAASASRAVSATVGYPARDKTVAFRRWRAGLPVRLALTLTTPLACGPAHQVRPDDQHEWPSSSANTRGCDGDAHARHDGEAEDVAVALNETQYQPRFAGDDLPSNPVACALAIADKMDTLAGIFGIGQHPKGDKDPFALRRCALGVLRIIVEKNLALDLQTLTEEAARRNMAFIS